MRHCARAGCGAAIASGKVVVEDGKDYHECCALSAYVPTAPYTVVCLRDLRALALEARSNASNEATRAYANGLVTALHVIEGLEGEPDLV